MGSAKYYVFHKDNDLKEKPIERCKCKVLMLQIFVDSRKPDLPDLHIFIHLGFMALRVVANITSVLLGELHKLILMSFLKVGKIMRKGDTSNTFHFFARCTSGLFAGGDS